MNDLSQTHAQVPAIKRIAAGQDQSGEFRGLGVSTVTFQVSSADSNGFFVLENTFHAKGGPVRHLHHDQDEWFYCVEGEFVFEIGPERMTLSAGDSVFVPRKTPHVWAYVGDTTGRILVAFTPAGKMEAFFREQAKANAMPAQDPEFLSAYGMELLGPPLPIA